MIAMNLVTLKVASKPKLCLCRAEPSEPVVNANLLPTNIILDSKSLLKQSSLFMIPKLHKTRLIA